MKNKGFIIIWNWKFFVIVGIIILIFWAYSSLNDNFSIENKKNLVEEIIDDNDKFSSVDKPHWTHMPLTYKYIEIKLGENSSYKCLDRKKEKIKTAFKYISNVTNNSVRFEEIEEGIEDITISCQGINSEFDDAPDGYYYQILGESLIEEYYNNKIISANLYFYVSGYGEDMGNCFDTELHEILHIFGYDHIEGRISIMNSMKQHYCLYKIDTEIVDCLKHIYSNGQGNDTCDNIPSIVFLSPSPILRSFF